MSQRNGRTIFTLIAAVMTVFLMVAPAFAGNHSSNAKNGGNTGKANGQGKSQSNGAAKSNGKAKNGPNNSSNASSGSSKGNSNANHGNSNANHGKSNANHGKSNANHGKSNGSHGNSKAKAKGDAKSKGKGGPKDKANDNGANGSDKITICHATGSTTNPFVTNTISVNGLNGHGHHEGDIIPAPEGGCPGVAGMGPGSSNDNDKITICHATSSETNPFVVITISVNGLNGHDGHEDDIIPAPEGGCDADGALGFISTDLTPSELDLVAAGSLGSDPITPELKTEEAQSADEVLSAGLVRDGSAGATSTATEVAAEAARPARILGGVLPFTGASFLAFLGAALGLIGAGLLSLRARRNS